MKKETVKASTRKGKKNGKAQRLRKYLAQPYIVELKPLPVSEGGGYLAVIPLLRGCQSDGATPDEAVRSVREAQRAWIESALKHNDPIPLPQ
ncbi:MAG: type II toxin-antitoxin system HicB family antitoxin [Bacteroidota bacterium]